MTKENTNLKEVVEKALQILTEQNKAFQENMVNKECKSKIYERIKCIEDRVVKIEDLISGNHFSKGIFDRIEETNEKIKILNNEVNSKISSINSTLSIIAGTLKENEIRKKTQATILKTIGSIISFIGVANILLLIKLLVK